MYQSTLDGMSVKISQPSTDGLLKCRLSVDRDVDEGSNEDAFRTHDPTKQGESIE